MMNSFHNTAISSKYQNAYNLFLTGQKDVATVYVEDISDKPFWNKLLSKVAKDRYVLKIYDRDTSSGKPALLKLLPDLNEHLKIAIDADLDHLFPVGNEHIHHDHVLHTFAYSRESILLETARLELFFNDLSALSNSNIQYADFMKRFSEQCFCALSMLASEYLENPKKLEKYNSAFDVLNPNIKVQAGNISHEQPYDIGQFEESAIHYLQEYGVNVNNAYRYINGHCLEKIIQQINLLHQKNILGSLNQDVRTKYQGEEISKRCKQNENILNQDYVLSTYVNSLELHASDEIVGLILEKIKTSFDRLSAIDS